MRTHRTETGSDTDKGPVGVTTRLDAANDNSDTTCATSAIIMTHMRRNIFTIVDSKMCTPTTSIVKITVTFNLKNSR